MNIKKGFQFSASSLQDFVDCPQRFELKYLKKIKWPALITEPVIENERRQEMGRRFHEMVHQHLLGLAPEQITAHINDPELNTWWENYLKSDLIQALPPQRFPEFSLSVPFLSYRVMAKYDLIAIQPDNQLVILDWKTSHKRTRNTWLKARIQTILYPYVLVEAGANLNSQKQIHPAQVKMIYWFTDFPNQPEIFNYDNHQHATSKQILEELIPEIANLKDGKFDKSMDERKCLFCNYRSLCNRGIQAGDWRSIEEENSVDIDGSEINFDEIGEIMI
jgi:hypothetical protein